MRVIAGRLKGRVLAEFEAANIRPTTDRVKETIFNKIQFHLEGARVLDLFSGTGNLAIEAFSREAAEIVAVEKHPKSLNVIFENIKKLKIDDGIRVVKADVFDYLKKFKDEPFDLVFIDPPFTEKLADQVMQKISTVPAVKPGGQVIIESSRHETIQDQYPGFILLDRRDFGDKSVSFFQKE